MVGSAAVGSCVITNLRFRFVRRWDLDLAVGAYLEKLRLGGSTTQRFPLVKGLQKGLQQ